MTCLEREEAPPTPAQSSKERLAWGVVGAGVLLTSFAVSPDLRGALGGALGLLMLAIAWTDFRRFIVPDALSGGAFALGLLFAFVANPEFGFEGPLLALARAAVAAGLFFAVRVAYRRFRGREGLGLGDVKLAAAAGAWLSPPMLPVAIEIAAVSCLAVYLGRQWRRKRALRAGARLPFGAFFAVAIWLTWILDTRLSDWG